MTDAARELLLCWIGLTALTSLTESLLPKDAVFRTARVAAALCYLAETASLLAGQLSKFGG